MKEFETYFSEETIVAYLCKLRAKVAKSRNKKHLIHLLTDSDKFNYHVNDAKKYFGLDMEKSNEFIKYQNEFLTDLNRLFPSRKKWITLGKDSRTDRKTNQPISSNDRNIYSLIKTIKCFRKKSPNEPWIIELDKFILDIQNSISSGNYRITSPVVYPKLKDKISKKDKNKCRPISLFSLKDRVILSLTNKFLTILFDKYFEDCSYAFRSKKYKDSTTILTHHDCIKDILDYRKVNENKALWVVECDMEKFYDSVNHKIIKQLFSELIIRAKEDYPYLNLVKPSLIFNEFLDCYAFNINVLPFNSNLTYWEQYNIPNGEYGWVEGQFKKLGYYKTFDTERIGVPQGGALSGLIANLVLNIADKEVLKTKVFYIRFCDDMLIMHSEQDECLKAKEVYINSLKQLKLIPHPFCNDLSIERKKLKKNLPSKTIQPFWEKKSKGPYKWASFEDAGFPWIGFVGYELHHEGYIRLRKRSLQKELTKQKEVVEEIRKAIKEKRRKSLGSVSESAIHRLVGMSVGRVSLKNFDWVENEMCWKKGFKELSMNKYSIQQIKQLDRSRNKLYYKLIRDLGEIEEEDNNISESKPRQIIHFNKPFSYYYQVLERKENDKKSDK